MEDIDALILCGGLGRRLRSIVSDRSKPMAPMHQRPFLDYLLKYLFRYDIAKVILCTGYKSEYIQRYYSHSEYGDQIVFSEEDKPLGTAGAVKNSEALIGSNPFLVMNGDSLCRVNLKEFLRFHRRKKALISIAVTDKGENEKAVGRVALGGNGRIAGFKEKSQKALSKNNFVNTGIYFCNKDVLSLILQNTQCSFEYDVFPGLNRCFGFVVHEALLDIGTPQGYRKTKKYLEKYS